MTRTDIEAISTARDANAREEDRIAALQRLVDTRVAFELDDFAEAARRLIRVGVLYLDG